MDLLAPLTQAAVMSLVTANADIFEEEKSCLSGTPMYFHYNAVLASVLARCVVMEVMVFVITINARIMPRLCIFVTDFDWDVTKDSFLAKIHFSR